MRSARSLDDLPAGPGFGRTRERLAWIARPEWLMEESQRRCGDVFTLQLPAGPTVFIANPVDMRAVFADTETFQAGKATAGFGPILGPGSTFLLDGDEHLRRCPHSSASSQDARRGVGSCATSVRSTRSSTRRSPIDARVPISPTATTSSRCSSRPRTRPARG